MGYVELGAGRGVVRCGVSLSRFGPSSFVDEASRFSRRLAFVGLLGLASQP
jgi:hypothetical protein